MVLPFHPVTETWFQETLGQPTDVQLRAWPSIADGDHVLVTAPTGTGKTLAAFLVGLDRLLTSHWSSGGLRLLYISPLKALNNDIRRNLLTPLAELRQRFEAAGLVPPTVEVMVRSGDTPEDERRRLRRRPPEILITTPESLNILLTQKGSAALFAGLEAVIVDEIHAVVGSKRGTSLLVALERLVDVAGEFQRIGLSATVNPVERVAQALGGFVDGAPRRVTIVESPASKAYDVRVVLAEKHPDPDTGKVFWESLALDLRKRVRERDSTLIFTNSRRACEKLARLMNENQDELIAYSHHGSLSKEIRHEVETRLKDGGLRALVATNSLELGIDVGDLDEVVLAQTPRSAASAIQKVGRAGHRTGQTSRARLYPSHGVDLVEAAVILRCIRQQTVEPVTIPEGPLDVLAQTLLSALCARPATSDQLYALVCRSWPYRNLSPRVFELVVDMLAGRYTGTRIPELKPRIEAGPDGLWSAKDAVAFLLYSSGGTIPDRGYFTLRDLRTGTALGELDEEFVWERTLGDRFALGAQVWKVAAIDDQAVRVEPVNTPPHIIPFWRAEDQDRGWFLAEKIGLFLEEADRILGAEASSGPWEAQLIDGGFSPEAARQLVHTLDRQRSLLGALPHRWRLVIERVVPDQPQASDRPDADQYVVHTFWGARVNRPWAFALAQAWEDRFGYALETYPGDDQILVLVPPESDLEEALAMVTPDNLEDLLRRRLEATGFFGARFREGAGRALLLPKAGFDKRTPLWQTRLKSKRLFEAVSGFAEFPILLEAWRQCLHDEFELDALKTRLDERRSGRIETLRCQTSQPSPFTEGILWRQVSKAMYEDDQPPARRSTHLDDSLWNQLVGDRPRLPRSLVDDWEARWGRTAPGYAPESASDLADFLEVRVALFPAEWRALVDACVRDSGLPEDEFDVPRVEGVRVAHPRLAALGSSPELWLRWLEGRGPVELSTMAAFWECPLADLEAWVQLQVNATTLVVGPLTEDALSDQVCLRRTWDQLVRRQRLVRRASIPVRPASGLALFLARWQGLVHPDRDPGNLETRLGPLLGLPLAAEHWEGAVLPCRVQPYHPADLDRLFIEGGLRWFGAGPGRIVLGFAEDRAAFVLPVEPDVTNPALADHDLASQVFRGTTEAPFADLAARSGLSTTALTDALWSLAWMGQASATTFGPLRQGLRSKFRYEPTTEAGRATRGFQRWSATRSGAGTWRLWGPPPTYEGLENFEETKRRARQVLDRYGIVFRTLLAHEAPAFQWKSIFGALRLMELSGEIVGGLFWEGVPGLQFATPEALRDLEAGGDEGALWVQAAQDPSSLCGLGLETWSHLPRRVAGTWLWWRGPQPVLTISGSGRRLESVSSLSDEEWTTVVRRAATLLLPEGKTHWALESIEGVAAAESPLSPALQRAGFRTHGEKLLYWRT